MSYNRLMKTFNWQLPDWPQFRYEIEGVHHDLLTITERAGYLRGKLAHLDSNQHEEALISLLMEEAAKTSEIEGEFISRLDICSSIKNKLGLYSQVVKVHDKRAEGVVDMMFHVREKFSEPITDTMLFDWHVMLLSSSNDPNLKIGTWRTHEDPMQIVSGNYNRLIVHYEAPPSVEVPEEMKAFIDWFNDTAPGYTQAIPYAPIRAAIAHLYFESIHPFEDGNGRIGRAIAEKALSQGFGYPILLSLSQVIESDKKAYYSALHVASKSNEITPWIHYFVKLVLQAQHEVEALIEFILNKSRFIERFHSLLNDRQLKVILRMLEAGKSGFEGGMSAKKYMNIAATSKATATRDLQHLSEIGALEQVGSGRSVRYHILIH